MELKLEPKKPRWWEKKWKIKKPVLYLLEYYKGEWINTFWWSGNWVGSDRVKFLGSAHVRVEPFFFPKVQSLLIVGKSGTTLIVKDDLGSKTKIKSLNPKTSEWTCFGKINGGQIAFTGEEKPYEFNLLEKMREQVRI